MENEWKYLWEIWEEKGGPLYYFQDTGINRKLKVLRGIEGIKVKVLETPELIKIKVDTGGHKQMREVLKRLEQKGLIKNVKEEWRKNLIIYDKDHLVWEGYFDRSSDEARKVLKELRKLKKENPEIDIYTSKTGKWHLIMKAKDFPSLSRALERLDEKGEILSFEHEVEKGRVKELRKDGIYVPISKKKFRKLKRIYNRKDRIPLQDLKERFKRLRKLR
jgi:hypothetical protein